MHAGNGQLHQKEKSRQLQRRLYLAAKKSRDRRFHALYDRIFRPDVLDARLLPVCGGLGKKCKPMEAVRASTA